MVARTADRLPNIIWRIGSVGCTIGGIDNRGGKGGAGGCTAEETVSAIAPSILGINIVNLVSEVVFQKTRTQESLATHKDEVQIGVAKRYRYPSVRDCLGILGVSHRYGVGCTYRWR